jgi:NAD(P)-dependent dehydrogenase (short-subunit alcohol dehydrogenase family)
VRVGIADESSIAAMMREAEQATRRARHPGQQRRADLRQGGGAADAGARRRQDRHRDQRRRLPAQSAYGVSKIALLGLTTTLATGLGPININVNAIAPGMTMGDAGLSLPPDDSPYVQAAMARVVMRPRGTPI